MHEWIRFWTVLFANTGRAFNWALSNAIWSRVQPWWRWETTSATGARTGAAARATTTAAASRRFRRPATEYRVAHIRNDHRRSLESSRLQDRACRQVAPGERRPVSSTATRLRRVLWFPRRCSFVLPGPGCGDSARYDAR